MTRTSAFARVLPATGIALGALLALPHAALAAASKGPPAGGAAIGQVIGATAAATLLTTALLVLGIRHRDGRGRVLSRAADSLSGLTGLPGWAVLPSTVATVGLLAAVFGLYWDVSLHIDNGRDPGPLANPAHYFILFGLFGIFTAGWLAMVLPTERPGKAAIRISSDWYAPVSGVLLMASASFALLGFPLDDIWHRLFGQDVTLWGPTHLMMLTGAALSLIGILGLLVEGRAAGERPWHGPAVLKGMLTSQHARTLRLVSACGGLLIGLSIYQGEFDFGVPQFRLLFEPVLIAFAASLALVAARVIIGRGGALGAVAFFLVVRGVLALLVGPILGQVTPHFPLYIAEALVVEAVAFAVSPRAPYRFAIAAGVGVGTLGVLAEWGWSHVWMPIAWPGHVVGPAIALAVPVAVAGGVIGGFLGGAVRVRPEIAAVPRAWAAVGASLLVFCAVVGFLLHTTVPQATAAVTLTDVKGGPHRMVQATIRFDPPAVARNADWVDEIAWQGHGKLVVGAMKRIGDGVYRTTKPLPVYGTWKSYLRLHRGDAMGSVPVYLPPDRAIPVPGVAAPAQFVRPLKGDHENLQRERKRNIPTWLWSTASVIVLTIALALLGLLGWGLARLAGTEASEATRDPTPSRPPTRAAAGVA